MSTWLPLVDGSGSTVALVNAATTGSPPAMTYTYDPTGNPTINGTAADWPFLYQGLEQEFGDLGPLYYSGGGQFYSPQLVRSLSETSQTSSSGPGGGPSGNAIAPPSGGGNGSFGHWLVGDLEGNLESQFSPNFNIDVSFNEVSYAIPVGPIIQGIENLISFFEWLFGGGDSPPIPRQLRHGRHPLYPVILGVSDGVIPDEVSAGKPEFCGDPEPCPNARPLRKKATPEYRKPRSNSFASGFSNCVANSIAGGALPCYVGICGAGIALFARGQKVIGGIAAGTGCGAAAATVFCCVRRGFGSDIECPSECPSNDREKGDGEIY